MSRWNKTSKKNSKKAVRKSFSKKNVRGGGFLSIITGNSRTAYINTLLLSEMGARNLTVKSFEKFNDENPITKEEYKSIDWKDRVSLLNRDVLNLLLTYATTYGEDVDKITLKKIISNIDKNQQKPLENTNNFDSVIGNFEWLNEEEKQKLLFDIVEKGTLKNLTDFTDLANSQYNFFAVDENNNNILHLAVKNPNAEMFKQMVEKVNTNVDFDDDAKKEMFNHLNNEQKRPIDLLIEKDTLITIPSSLNNDSLKTLIDNQSNFSNIKNFFTGKIGEITNNKTKYSSNPEKTKILNTNETKYTEALQLINLKEKELHTYYDADIKQKAIDLSDDNENSPAKFAYEQIKNGVTVEGEPDNSRTSKSILSAVSTVQPLKDLNTIWDSQTKTVKGVQMSELGSRKGYNEKVEQKDINAFNKFYNKKLDQLCEDGFMKVLEEWPFVTSYTKAIAPATPIQQSNAPEQAPMSVQAAGKRSLKNRRKSKGKSSKK